MDERAIIQLDYRQMNKSLATELRQVFPDGLRADGRGFYCALPANDPRVAQLLTILSAAGLHRWNELDSSTDCEFYHVLSRDYAPVDLEAFRLLEPVGNPNFHDYCGTDEQGNLCVKRSFFKKHRLLTDGDIHSLLVSADIRSALETESFKGMTFKPALPRPGKGPVSAENLFELTSEERMPPLSSQGEFMDSRGQRVTGSSEVGYHYAEGLYSTPELHYTEASLQRWHWPDFALTHELFYYAPRRHRRRMVVSQRFYQFCRVNKLRMDWLPVRIDT